MPRERISIAPTAGSSRMVTRPSETLSADRVLTVAELEQFQAVTFASGAARNLDLPAEGACAGSFLFIRNAFTAAFALTVRNPAAGTVLSLAQNKSGLVWCDGTTWHGVAGA
jgi:hypothetical protein